MAAIVTEGLTRRFDGTVAVDGLDLSVAEGEVFGLVGPDGAGKTTTIRMLTTVTAPTAGRAVILGHDAAAEAERVRARIGYMAQRFTLYRDLTVRENLAFFADTFDVRGDEREARIERLVAFAGLDRFQSRRAGHLSGGMQKKLALACTLVHRPEVLFLDEPTTGVDPVSRRELWSILADLHLSGMTIVVSTPYMDEAERCSRVALLMAGRLVTCDTPARIRATAGGTMLEVTVPDPRRVRGYLVGAPGVRDVQTYGDRLHVLVDEPEIGSASVASALEAAGAAGAAVRVTRPRLEEAFVSLVGSEAGTR